MNASLSCCFIGHRKIEESEKLINDLQLIIEDLIVNKGVSRFMFGSKSQFNDLCYDIVSELKNKYAHIVIIYVRSMYENLTPYYEEYLYEIYDETIYPDCVKNSNRLSYIKRNEYMINNSDFCVFYYEENYKPRNYKGVSRNSGTKIALDYAKQKKKSIIVLSKN